MRGPARPGRWTCEAALHGRGLAAGARDEHAELLDRGGRGAGVVRVDHDRRVQVEQPGAAGEEREPADPVEQVAVDVEAASAGAGAT